MHIYISINTIYDNVCIQYIFIQYIMYIIYITFTENAINVSVLSVGSVLS